MFTRALYNVYSYREDEVTEKNVTYKRAVLVEGSYTPPCHFGIPQKGGMTISGKFKTDDGEIIKRRPEEVTRDRKGLIKLLNQANAQRYQKAKIEADAVDFSMNQQVTMNNKNIKAKVVEAAAEMAKELANE